MVVKMDAMVKDYLERAATSVKQAADCLDCGDYPTSILRSAEAVEFALKSALMLVGQSYGKKHDVSEPLAKAFQNFPPPFKDKIPRFRYLSRIFTSLSLDAKYGDEILVASPKALFSVSEAKVYIEIAREVLGECQKLQGEREKN